MCNGESRAGKGTSLDGVAKNAECLGELLLLPVESGWQRSGW